MGDGDFGGPRKVDGLFGGVGREGGGMFFLVLVMVFLLLRFLIHLCVCLYYCVDFGECLVFRR